MTDCASESGTRASLLLRIRDPQDVEAWQVFAKVYTPLVYSYCRHRGLQEADAADVTQEVLMRVARSISTFEYDPQIGRFRDWLGTVTRNQLLSFVQRNRRATSGTGWTEAMARLESPEPDPVWVDRFHAHILDVALERLRPEFTAETWRAFERVWLDGLAASQVAAELNEPIDKIYVSKSRVLKRLRQEIILLAEDIPFTGRPVGKN